MECGKTSCCGFEIRMKRFPWFPYLQRTSKGRVEGRQSYWRPTLQTYSWNMHELFETNIWRGRRRSAEDKKRRRKRRRRRERKKEKEKRIRKSEASKKLNNGRGKKKNVRNAWNGGIHKVFTRCKSRQYTFETCRLKRKTGVWKDEPTHTHTHTYTDKAGKDKKRFEITGRCY